MSCPRGFQRLRHYGLLANRGRQAKLGVCRVLLQQQTASPTADALLTPKLPPAPDRRRPVCPACQRGRMSWVETLRPQPDALRQEGQPPGWDTS